MSVRQYLNLDVPRLRHELLQIHGVVPESTLRFAPCRFESCGKLFRTRHDAHALPAAARRGFEQNGIPEFLGDFFGFLCVCQRFGSSGNDGDSARHCQRARGGFASHRGNSFGGWPNPDEACIAHGAGEPLSLGEETVTRVNRFGARELRGLDDSLAAKVALARGRRPDQNCFVRFAHVRRANVCLAVDGDRTYSHLVTGADDAQRDLATICDENFIEHQESASV